MIITLKQLLEMSLWDSAPKIGLTDVVDPMQFYQHADKMLNKKYVEVEEIVKRMRECIGIENSQEEGFIYEYENVDLHKFLNLIEELEGKR